MFKRRAPKPDESPAKKPKVEPWIAPMHKGKKEFTLGHFDRACQYFKEALSHAPHDLVILDCSAVAHAKANRMREAVQDAEAMITAAPESIRGYLRAGKLYAQQKNYDKAHAVYQRGLQSAAVTRTEKTQFLTLIDKVRKYRTLRDFVTILPYDVCAIIFSHVAFHRRIQCLQVSRSWRSFLLAWPPMWRDIDFLTPTITVRSLKAYQPLIAGHYVRSFAFQQGRCSVKNALRFLVDIDCHRLERLHIDDCDESHLLLQLLRRLGKNLVHVRLTNSGLGMANALPIILQECKALTHLEFDSDVADNTRLAPYTFPADLRFSLQHLQLRTNTAESVGLLSDILKRSPHLRHVRIDSRDYVGLGSFVLDQLFTLCTGLESVYYGEQPCGKMRAIAEDTTDLCHDDVLRRLVVQSNQVNDEALLPWIQTHAERLEVLDLIHSPRLTERVLSTFVSFGAPCLRELHLKEMNLTTEALCSMVQQCPQLTIVTLTGMPGVTNAVLMAFGTAGTLESLNISRCPNVTGVGVLDLVSKNAAIKCLVLDDCWGIGRDAVDLARNRLGHNVVRCKFTR